MNHASHSHVIFDRGYGAGSERGVVRRRHVRHRGHARHHASTLLLAHHVQLLFFEPIDHLEIRPATVLATRRAQRVRFVLEVRRQSLAPGRWRARLLLLCLWRNLGRLRPLLEGGLRGVVDDRRLGRLRDRRLALLALRDREQLPDAVVQLGDLLDELRDLIALCGGLLALGRELELLRFECSPLRGVLTKQRLDVDHTRRRSRVAIGVDPLPRFLRPEASIPATPRGGEVDPREQ